MKAIIFDGKEFQLIEKETPIPEGRDILVKIKAISVNPIDTKVKKMIEGTETLKILGWDASGIVEAIGENVKNFKVGDEVFYAGDITRDGSYATHQLVDECIVGFKPKNLSFEESAALPLTSIAAWEALFDRLNIDPEKDKSKRILIIGGAGGVGSIAIQLAKKVAGLKVIATASRDESKNWCRSLGADGVLDHRKDLREEMDQLKIKNFDYILCLNNTDQYFSKMSEIIKPQGKICSLVSTEKEHDLDILKKKSVTFVWEFMFTRSMFNTDDVIEQSKLLNKLSDLLDAGIIKTTKTSVESNLNIENLNLVHQLIESGKSIGKIVLSTVE
ncbi:MAG: zinc-binding alcohol dehydrogenase family protein [Candidatus Delongbacteria bacterium]|jgi:NADPH2:quinone reductase|nr:zinc-binding alcohol dehydrogenase family protein [Candidatus Delongbacteria bacterium]